MLIHEVVLGETLERPVHFSEKLLDLTLRWGSWQGNIALKYFHNINKNFPMCMVHTPLYDVIDHRMCSFIRINHFMH